MNQPRPLTVNPPGSGLGGIKQEIDEDDQHDVISPIQQMAWQYPSNYLAQSPACAHDMPSSTLPNPVLLHHQMLMAMSSSFAAVQPLPPHGNLPPPSVNIQPPRPRSHKSSQRVAMKRFSSAGTARGNSSKGPGQRNQDKLETTIFRNMTRFINKYKEDWEELTSMEKETAYQELEKFIEKERRKARRKNMHRQQQPIQQQLPLMLYPQQLLHQQELQQQLLQQQHLHQQLLQQQLHQPQSLQPAQEGARARKAVANDDDDSELSKLIDYGIEMAEKNLTEAQASNQAEDVAATQEPPSPAPTEPMLNGESPPSVDYNIGLDAGLFMLTPATTVSISNSSPFQAASQSSSFSPNENLNQSLTSIGNETEDMEAEAAEEVQQAGVLIAETAEDNEANGEKKAEEKEENEDGVEYRQKGPSCDVSEKNSSDNGEDCNNESTGVDGENGPGNALTSDSGNPKLDARKVEVITLNEDGEEEASHFTAVASSWSTEGQNRKKEKGKEKKTDDVEKVEEKEGKAKNADVGEVHELTPVDESSNEDGGKNDDDRPADETIPAELEKNDDEKIEEEPSAVEKPANDNEIPSTDGSVMIQYTEEPVDDDREGGQDEIVEEDVVNITPREEGEMRPPMSLVIPAPSIGDDMFEAIVDEENEEVKGIVEYKEISSQKIPAISPPPTEADSMLIFTPTIGEGTVKMDDDEEETNEDGDGEEQALDSLVAVAHDDKESSGQMESSEEEDDEEEDRSTKDALTCIPGLIEKKEKEDIEDYCGGVKEMEKSEEREEVTTIEHHPSPPLPNHHEAKEAVNQFSKIDIVLYDTERVDGSGEVDEMDNVKEDEMASPAPTKEIETTNPGALLPSTPVIDEMDAKDDGEDKEGGEQMGEDADEKDDSMKSIGGETEEEELASVDSPAPTDIEQPKDGLEEPDTGKSYETQHPSTPSPSPSSFESAVLKDDAIEDGVIKEGNEQMTPHKRIVAPLPPTLESSAVLISASAVEKESGDDGEEAGGHGDEDAIVMVEKEKVEEEEVVEEEQDLDNSPPSPAVLGNIDGYEPASVPPPLTPPMDGEGEEEEESQSEEVTKGGDKAEKEGMKECVSFRVNKSEDAEMERRDGPVDAPQFYMRPSTPDEKEEEEFEYDGVEVEAEEEGNEVMTEEISHAAHERSPTTIEKDTTIFASVRDVEVDENNGQMEEENKDEEEMESPPMKHAAPPTKESFAALIPTPALEGKEPKGEVEEEAMDGEDKREDGEVADDDTIEKETANGDNAEEREPALMETALIEDEKKKMDSMDMELELVDDNFPVSPTVHGPLKEDEIKSIPSASSPPHSSMDSSRVHEESSNEEVTKEGEKAEKEGMEELALSGGENELNKSEEDEQIEVHHVLEDEQILLPATPLETPNSPHEEGKEDMEGGMEVETEGKEEEDEGLKAVKGVEGEMDNAEYGSESKDGKELFGQKGLLDESDVANAISPTSIITRFDRNTPITVPASVDEVDEQKAKMEEEITKEEMTALMKTTPPPTMDSTHTSVPALYEKMAEDRDYEEVTNAGGEGEIDETTADGIIEDGKVTEETTEEVRTVFIESSFINDAVEEDKEKPDEALHVAPPLDPSFLLVPAVQHCITPPTDALTEANAEIPLPSTPPDTLTDSEGEEKEESNNGEEKKEEMDACVSHCDGDVEEKSKEDGEMEEQYGFVFSLQDAKIPPSVTPPPSPNPQGAIEGEEENNGEEGEETVETLEEDDEKEDEVVIENGSGAARVSSTTSVEEEKGSDGDEQQKADMRKKECTVGIDEEEKFVDEMQEELDALTPQPVVPPSILNPEDQNEEEEDSSVREEEEESNGDEMEEALGEEAEMGGEEIKEDGFDAVHASSPTPALEEEKRIGRCDLQAVDFAEEENIDNEKEEEPDTLTPLPFAPLSTLNHVDENEGEEDNNGHQEEGESKDNETMEAEEEEADKEDEEISSLDGIPMMILLPPTPKCPRPSGEEEEKDDQVEEDGIDKEEEELIEDTTAVDHSRSPSPIHLLQGTHRSSTLAVEEEDEEKKEEDEEKGEKEDEAAKDGGEEMECATPAAQQRSQSPTQLLDDESLTFTPAAEAEDVEEKEDDGEEDGEVPFTPSLDESSSEKDEDDERNDEEIQKIVLPDNDGEGDMEEKAEGKEEDDETSPPEIAASIVVTEEQVNDGEESGEDTNDDAELRNEGPPVSPTPSEASAIVVDGIVGSEDDNDLPLDERSSHSSCPQHSHLEEEEEEEGEEVKDGREDEEDGMNGMHQGQEPEENEEVEDENDEEDEIEEEGEDGEDGEDDNQRVIRIEDIDEGEEGLEGRMERREEEDEEEDMDKDEDYLDEGEEESEEDERESMHPADQWKENRRYRQITRSATKNMLSLQMAKERRKEINAIVKRAKEKMSQVTDDPFQPLKLPRDPSPGRTTDAPSHLPPIPARDHSRVIVAGGVLFTPVSLHRRAKKLHQEQRGRDPARQRQTAKKEEKVSDEGCERRKANKEEEAVIDPPSSIQPPAKNRRNRTAPTSTDPTRVSSSTSTIQPSLTPKKTADDSDRQSTRPTVDNPEKKPGSEEDGCTKKILEQRARGPSKQRQTAKKEEKVSDEDSSKGKKKKEKREEEVVVANPRIDDQDKVSPPARRLRDSGEPGTSKSSVRDSRRSTEDSPKKSRSAEGGRGKKRPSSKVPAPESSHKKAKTSSIPPQESHWERPAIGCSTRRTHQADLLQEERRLAEEAKLREQSNRTAPPMPSPSATTRPRRNTSLPAASTTTLVPAAPSSSISTTRQPRVPSMSAATTQAAIKRGRGRPTKKEPTKPKVPPTTSLPKTAPSRSSSVKPKVKARRVSEKASARDGSGNRLREETKKRLRGDGPKRNRSASKNPLPAAAAKGKRRQASENPTPLKKKKT